MVRVDEGELMRCWEVEERIKLWHHAPVSRKRSWWAVVVFAGLIWVFLVAESRYFAYYPFALIKCSSDRNHWRRMPSANHTGANDYVGAANKHTPCGLNRNE